MLEDGRRVTEYGLAQRVGQSWIGGCGTGAGGCSVSCAGCGSIPPFSGLRMEEAEGPRLPPAACACGLSGHVLPHHPGSTVTAER